MQIKHVRAITPLYWVAILVASMCGANTGDFLSHNLHLPRPGQSSAPVSY